jgi:hypothetical protein
MIFKLRLTGVPRNDYYIDNRGRTPGLSHTIKEYYWWKRLFEDIGLDLEDEGSTPILCDNQQTVGLLQKEQPVLGANHWGKPATWNPLTT